VAANFRKEVTSTVLWLRNYHSVDITCIKVAPYKDGEKLYLDVEQIIPIQDAQDYQIRLTAKKQEETITSKNDAARHKLRRSFWEMALPILRERTKLYGNISPTTDNWLYGASGHSGIVYSSIVRLDGARAELYINSNDSAKNKKIFHKLRQKVEVENNNYDHKFDWRELPEKKSSCVSLHYNDYGLSDEEHWNDVAEFLADSIATLIDVFKPLLDDAVKD
jgi:hypothetical protein